MNRVLAAGLLLLAGSISLAADPFEDRGAPAGKFDFYVLSLSWSASFCELTGRARKNEQCEPGRNPGFVVHGLWPQYERGYPSFCEPQDRNPPRRAMEIAAAVFPDQGLARHEWRKHGSCAGGSPADYFDLVTAARAKVKIPDEFVAPDRERQWVPLDIERAFSKANPGLRTDMMAVACDRSRLKEVRICLTRDLRSFRPCPEVDRDSCRLGEITAPAAR